MAKIQAKQAREILGKLEESYRLARMGYGATVAPKHSEEELEQLREFLEPAAKKKQESPPEDETTVT